VAPQDIARQSEAPSSRPSGLSSRQGALLLVILTIAAVMRLGKIGISQYQYDEMALSILSKDLVAGRAIPTLGIPSSIGMPNTPISVYIIAIPYALSSNPLFATMFVAVYNVAGVGLLWLLIRRYGDPAAAFWASLIYATNLWAVLFSRNIWEQDLLGTLTLWSLWTGMLGFKEGKRWAQLVCLPSLILAAQIHYSALALLPLYPYLLWLGRKRLSGLSLTVGAVLAFLAILPFVIGLFRASPEEQERVRSYLYRRDRGFSITDQTLKDSYQLITGYKLETWLAPRQAKALGGEIPTAAPLWKILAGAALLGVVALWASPAHRSLAGMLCLWAALPILIFGLNWTGIHIHYLIIALPALCALAGSGIAWLWTRRCLSLISKPAVAGIMGIILLTQGLWWNRILEYVDQHATPDGMGSPLHYYMPVRKELVKYDDVLIVNESYWAWGSMLLNEVSSVREVALAQGGIMVIPEGPFAVVTYEKDREYNSYQTDHSLVFPLRPGEGTYRVDVFENGFEWVGSPITAIPPVRFDNGVQLTGYNLAQDTITFEWILPSSVNQNYYYFVHFLNAQGDRIGQIDTDFWPGHYWRVNDRLLTWISVARPESAATLRVGLYRLQNGSYVNSNVLDQANNALSPWVDVPLVAAESSWLKTTPYRVRLIILPGGGWFSGPWIG
jgi:hypothetical protein